MGDEPDAAQRVDAEIPAGGAAPGGRRAGAGGVWGVEVGGFATFYSFVERTAAGMVGSRSFPARHPGGADPTSARIWFWSRRETSAGADGRRDGERCRGAGAHRQPARARA